MLYLAKVINYVHHEMLLSTLSYFRLDRSACKWFASYLANRRQRVTIRTSDTYDVCFKGDKFNMEPHTA
jgi:hypothetical protein